MVKQGRLYLIPGPIGQGNPTDVLSEDTLKQIRLIRYFIVENQKNAIRMLVGCGMKDVLDECEFGLLNEHTKPEEFGFLMEPVYKGRDAGIITDAGCPGIADPGAELVALAHIRQIEVVPLIGPTSIILAIMGSGLNGQTFAFQGYLPVRPGDRIRKIRDLEKRSSQNRETQIFIEAPYRNRQLMDDLVANLRPDTRLCIASNLTQPVQILKTALVSHWSTNPPEIHKKPTVFLFLA